MCEYTPSKPNNDADPVGFMSDGTWGFWDETWAHWNGGYKNEAEARAALKEYCEKFL